jgi:hypothetical protein
MVPSWLLDLQPDGAELRAYCHLASFGRFDTARGLYEECRPSLAKLSERSGLSETHLKRALAGLVQKGAIERSQRWAEDGKTCLPSVYRVIFGSLNGPRGAADGPGGGAADGPEGGPPVSRNPEPSTQNQKTQKKDPSSASPRRGTRLPEDFKPDDALRAWYRDRIGNAVDGLLEHEKFMNFWLSKPGKAGEKLDWRRTWQNWMLEALARSGRRPTAAGQKPATTRFPTAQERTQAAREEHVKWMSMAEAYMEQHGMDLGDILKMREIATQIRTQYEKTAATRTSGMYSEGDVIDAEIVPPKEVTAGEAG